jgi:hypothetical protein
VSLAVVLPGRAFPVTMPLLRLAVDALERHGHDVRAVTWTPPDPLPDDPTPWVVERLEEALADGAPGVVVAKSLGTRAAGWAAERGVPAVWLTPLLRDPGCLAGVRGNPAPQLVVAGLADPLHDPSVSGSLGCDVLELEGADHALSRTGDADLGDDAARIEAALDGFLARLGSAA